MQSAGAGPSHPGFGVHPTRLLESVAASLASGFIPWWGVLRKAPLPTDPRGG